nr:protein kinase [Pseudanabaena sp. FACHB-2040]
MSLEGEFVRTFQGLDLQTAQKIIIKQILLPTEILRNRAKQQRIINLFNEAAQKLQGLTKVVNLHTPLDYSVMGNGLYLIEEAVAGETVAQLLEKQGQFKEKQIRQLLNDLLPSLQELHDSKFIHRDIRPENIVYSHHLGQFLLTNFGIPQLVAECLREDVPSTGEYMVGDPSYSSPEQVNGQAAPTSDVYSLGVVCLQALTAMKPIDLMGLHDSSWAYKAYLTENLISKQLQQVVDQMTAPSALNRYVSAKNALTDLTASTDSSMEQVMATAAKIAAIVALPTPLTLLQSGAGLVTKSLLKLPGKAKS